MHYSGAALWELAKRVVRRYRAALEHRDDQLVLAIQEAERQRYRTEQAETMYGRR